MTDHQFTVLAGVLGEDLTPDIAANVIQGMFETAEGVEMLRQIVRDFPGSEAADRIIDTLWDNL